MKHPDIIPQKQANRHLPDQGIYGDCWRTCIAMLLGLDRDGVPHFLHDNCEAEEFKRRTAQFLSKRGLQELNMVWPGDTALGDVLMTIENLNPSVPFILAGKSATGCNHAVVCQYGKIVADPSLTDAGIVGPCEPDGYYWAHFIVGFPILEGSENDSLR